MGLETLTGDLIYSYANGVAKLVLNRPEKLNALSVDMYHGIDRVVAEVNNNDEIRVLVITGAGRGFCSGADVEAQLALRIGSERGEENLKDRVLPLGWVSSVIGSVRKPVIASVNGIAAGGGLSIALLCDIRIASDQARFAAIWVKRGLAPDLGATYLLPRTIGLDKALELTLTGQIIDAREAERIGLVTRVVPHDQLIDMTNALALKIAGGPSVAVELTKRGFYKGLSSDLNTQLEFETYTQGVCFSTKDFEEGIQAFREKREPRFLG